MCLQGLEIAPLAVIPDTHLSRNSQDEGFLWSKMLWRMVVGMRRLIQVLWEFPECWWCMGCAPGG